MPVHPDIAIIAIDDRSIAALGRFPWTRQQYVHLLNRLEATRRRAILPDVFFPAPESSGLGQALADVLRRLGPAELATPFEIDRRLRDISRLESLPVLGSAAAGVGHINLIPEEEGVSQRKLLLFERDGQTAPALGLKAPMVALSALAGAGPGALRAPRRLPERRRGGGQYRFTRAEDGVHGDRRHRQSGLAPGGHGQVLRGGLHRGRRRLQQDLRHLPLPPPGPHTGADTQGSGIQRQDASGCLAGYFGSHGDGCSQFQSLA
ncbi:MAG: CHASE2 domain-containing protein [Curvibacter sp.]